MIVYERNIKKSESSVIIRDIPERPLPAGAIDIIPVRMCAVIEQDALSVRSAIAVH
jgi:hypothetical protein